MDSDEQDFEEPDLTDGRRTLSTDSDSDFLDFFDFFDFFDFSDFLISSNLSTVFEPEPPRDFTVGDRPRRTGDRPRPGVSRKPKFTSAKVEPDAPVSARGFFFNRGKAETETREVLEDRSWSFEVPTRSGTSRVD